jgi:dTDP-4-amino-4,6-dideoxygalactose transaminase
LPEVAPTCAPVWHLFVVRHPERGRLSRQLAEAGIGTVIHYPTAPHRQEAYAEMKNLALPIAEQLHAEVLSLPVGPHMTEEQTDYVIDRLRAIL